ncbi:hypothetical protein BRADI_4g30785v3 [Brachypodium distachyon]|uniref:Uncharacterized protein n=1 Tax=Brachypodium distachyon TaxID=15368 RepID=A0A2K2CRI9_BRADI|nr:hypothetical protein BRADI_4g30785v3 [Brachypodium distachyon]
MPGSHLFVAASRIRWRPARLCWWRREERRGGGATCLRKQKKVWFSICSLSLRSFLRCFRSARRPGEEEEEATWTVVGGSNLERIWRRF